MPTSLAGLLIFVVFLAPGFVFVVVREARFPRRICSAFRETALLVLASTLANLGAVLLFGVARALLAGRTPDVGLLVREPERFVHAYYLSTFVWGLVVAAIACALAGAVAQWGPEFPGAISSRSAWCLAFEDERGKDHGIYVGCELTDGTYIAGYLKRFSTEPEETGDRDLTLEAPISYSAGDQAAADLEVNMAVVSARQVKFLTCSCRELVGVPRRVDRRVPA